MLEFLRRLKEEPENADNIRKAAELYLEDLYQMCIKSGEPVRQILLNAIEEAKDELNTIIEFCNENPEKVKRKEIPSNHWPVYNIKKPE